MHNDTHPLAGATVRLTTPEFSDHPFRLEDWWDKLTGGSWMFAAGNPAAISYAIRNAQLDLPVDDEVVYGKIGSLGYLIHVSELGELVRDKT